MSNFKNDFITDAYFESKPGKKYEKYNHLWQITKRKLQNPVLGSYLLDSFLFTDNLDILMFAIKEIKINEEILINYRDHILNPTIINIEYERK